MHPLFLIRRLQIKGSFGGYGRRLEDNIKIELKIDYIG
jgi:hypothetical protein